MKKEIKDIDVKDLVKEINTSTVSGKVITEETRAKARRDNVYEYVAASGCDFILNRKTIKTDKTLVCIQGKGLLFIMDEKSEEKTDVTDPKQLKSFFSDKHAEDLVIEPEILSYAKAGIRKKDLDTWFMLIKAESPAAQYLLKRGLIQFNVVNERYYLERNRWQVFDECYNRNPNLLSEVFKKFNKSNFYDYNTIVSTVNSMYDLSDANTTRYYIDQLVESSVILNGTVKFETFKEYNLDTRRFIDYILFDLYKQGQQYIDLNTYNDYLRQSMNYYGKIKEKYPKSLATEHQIISSKIAEKERLKASSPKFAEIMEETEDFSYRNPLDKFAIVMPKQSSELVDEGQYLCHCVASYVEKVNNGDCIVVFMRLKEQEDVPYLTIEILPDRSVPQVEGMSKRSELTEEEILFINRWAKFKHLKITAPNAIMSKKKKEIA